MYPAASRLQNLVNDTHILQGIFSCVQKEDSQYTIENIRLGTIDTNEVSSTHA